MKYAVISDIHGNLPALQAVLADAKEQGADAYIFGGDYCLSGPYPNECLELIRAIPGAYIIRGNEEGHLEKLIGTDPAGWTDGQMQITYYNYKILSKDNFDYLMVLPKAIDLECNGVPIHIAHDKSVFLGDTVCDYYCSSLIATKYAGRTITKEQLVRDIYEMVDGDETFRARLAEMSAGVYIFGHSHVQWCYQSRDKRIITMNPGACGLPLDCVLGSVPYSMLEISEDGEVAVDERRVAFDVEAYAEMLTKTEQYHEATVWTKVILKELRHAREHLAFFLPFTEQYAQSIGDERRPYAVDTWEKAYEQWERSLGGYTVRATPILRYREYYTFQGYYRLDVSPTASGGTTGEEIFAKAVLYVVKWLKERLSADSYMKSMIEAEYSEVEDYKDFLLRLRNSRGFEQRGEKEYDLNIFCYTKPDLNWALRLTEPDNGRETQAYPGRIFITDISLQCADGAVRLAIRLTCREPQNITSEALLFRTAFLSEIYKDPDIMMYEGTMPGSRYPANGRVIELNTKSETDCRDMYEGLLLAKERQMPVAFLPAGEEDTEVYADKLGGIAYVVMEQEAKNYAKLFGKTMGRSELSDAIKAGRYICFMPIGCEGEDAQIFDDRDELKRFLKRYTVHRDGISKKPGITFGDNLFYKKLWARYITEVEDAADTELFEQLNERISILQQKASDPVREDEFRAQTESLQRDIEELKERIESLKRKNKDYIEQINERKSENNRLKAKLREYEAVPEVDEAAVAREESRKRREQIRGEAERYQERFSVNPTKRDDVIPWIRENFSERIEVHPDAEKSFRKYATSDLPIGKFCGAVILLNAVADNRYGELSGDVLEELKTDAFPYCELSKSGFDRDTAPPAAFIRLAGEGEKRLLNEHLKYSANTNSAFRMYFLFDDEHKRVVIGSMPDHLAQSVTDSNFGNRREKA